MDHQFLHFDFLIFPQYYYLHCNTVLIFIATHFYLQNTQGCPTRSFQYLFWVVLPESMYKSSVELVKRSQSLDPLTPVHRVAESNIGRLDRSLVSLFLELTKQNERSSKIDCFIFFLSNHSPWLHFMFLLLSRKP
jgi:hypothetical protein